MFPKMDGTEAKPPWVAELVREEVAVLVSDLSGFTSKTRKHGIIHFAGVIIRKRQLCLPIFKRLHAIHVGTEGDNLIVAFHSPLNAAKAALEMQHVINAHNASLEESHSHFRIQLNGIGVHCDRGLLVDTDGDLLGKALTGAYFIGEDLVKGGHVLVSKAVKEKVEYDDFFRTATFSQYSELMPDSEPCYTIGGSPGPIAAELVPTGDSRYLRASLLTLCSRHDASAVDLEVMDQQISRKYMVHRAVLMFALDLLGDSESGCLDSVGFLLEVMARKRRTMEHLRPALEGPGGVGLEDMLWTFEQPADAVVAALATRNMLRELNAQHKDGAQRVHIHGYGVHCGQLLCIDGTDVHWGDPVNTASKLGQDTARDEELLITPEVRESLQQDSRLADCSFEERCFSKSGIDFVCFCVKSGKAPGLFEQLDLNGDGVLSRAELEAACDAGLILPRGLAAQQTADAAGAGPAAIPLTGVAARLSRAGFDVPNTQATTQKAELQHPVSLIGNGYHGQEIRLRAAERLATASGSECTA
jgi:class 3 adenylate cyclase